MRISVGWPGGGTSKAATTGECWTRSASADGINQVFISPMRGEADTVEVLGTLGHEMIHVIDDCASGHKGNFVVVAKHIGMKAPFAEAGNRTDDYTAVLEAIAEKLGPFPNAAMNPGFRAADAPPKQKSRQLKIECPECHCIARMSRGAIDAHGLPTCACGTEFEEAS
jgi:hypothetical protein